MIGIGITTQSRIASVAMMAALGLAGLGTAPALAAPATLYGDPAAAAPFWRYQELDDDCIPMAVADVVGELTGNEPTEHEIVEVARTTPSTVHSGPVYKPGQRKRDQGTSFEDGPTLLAHYGIHAVSIDHVTMETLEQDLAGGRKVIAGVNAELLWGQPVVDKTSDGQPDANHSVVVTGVDTAAGVVHLNDSGSETGSDEKVPMAVFIRSWASSDDQMTVTG